MRKSIKSISLLATLFCLFGCGWPSSIKPEFKEGDKVINELTSKYNCEAVEFENWGDSDPGDSTLTVLLINSKSLPSISPDNRHDELKKIAYQIKYSLRAPEKYKSFYVIFIKQEDNLMGGSRVHSGGSDISTEEL